MPKPGVFISYARKDGAELAQRLLNDLAPDFDVWLDTRRIAGGASWTVEIEKAIDRSQVVLALLTPGSYVSDICRAEQLRSLRKGKSVIPLLAQVGTDIPLHLETKNYRDFTRGENYSDGLRFLREDIASGRGAVPLAERFRLTRVTAPPLPRNYIERPEAILNLRNALITDDPGPSIALTALRGMGGIGKTILAQASSHDEVIQAAFPDGVIWTTVGREPAYDLLTRMQEVRRALGDEPPDHESELQCINSYRTALRDRAALVIMDDVWRSADIAPFLAESGRSRILFTTRDASVAAAVGAEEHVADLLTVGQSRALLARWAGWKPEDLPDEADDLIRECGRLPLALSMTGAMLRGKPPGYWSHVNDLLRNADLEKIKAQFPGYPHPDLFRAIQVSIDALDDIARKRYLALAVLLEDMAAAPAVQQTLWNSDEPEALETAERFVSLSLAQRDGEGGGIRLHDLQLDYVRAQHPDREALRLIHEAVRLSTHVIAKDPCQFASQLVGRLLPHKNDSTIRQFMDEIAAGAPVPWLRPLHPALHPPGTPLQRTLEGHSHYVFSLAVTADGKWAVSASWDKTLKVWDVETGRALRTLEGHSAHVWAVAVAPDSQRAVSASDDKTLRVWDLGTGRALHTLEGHSVPVRGVAVTPDGKRAVSASYDGTLKVWDLESGLSLRTLEGYSGGVTGVAVTPDGKRAVSASWDKTLKVWDLETGRALRTLEGHSSLVTGVAVTPDGKRAVSSSDDKTLKVWDLETGGVLRTLEGHSQSVNGVAVTPDGKRAVSSSDDKTLKVWDLEIRRALRTLEGHSESVNGVAVTADRQRAVSASHDKTLKVWDLESGRALRTLEGHSDSVTGVAVTPDGKRAVSVSWDKTLKVWELETGRALSTLGGHLWGGSGVAVTPDGKRAVSASWTNMLMVWDLETGRELREMEELSDSVTGVAVTPDGQRAVSSSDDKTLKVWDLETGRALRTLAGHSGSVTSVAVTPDGQRAVSASGDRTLKVWDLETGRALRTLEGHSDSVLGVAVTLDAERAVSASSDNTLKVWDLETGLVLATFHCDAPATSSAFIDNHRIVAGDSAGRLYFLSLEEPRRPPNHKNAL